MTRRVRSCTRDSYHLSPVKLHTWTCAFVRLMRLKKLVVDEGVWTLSDNIPMFRGLETLVYIRRCPRSAYFIDLQGTSFPYSSAGIRRIVQVFWADKPFETSEESDQPKRSDRIAESTHPVIRLHITNVALGLAWHIDYHPQLEEIVIVNGAQARRVELQSPALYSRQIQIAEVESMATTTLSKRADFEVKHHPGRIDVEYNKQIIKIKFVSLQEYLRTYDWSGEFTEKEVKPWLEDDDFETS